MATLPVIYEHCFGSDCSVPRMSTGRLYVVSGEGDQTCDGRTIWLKAGMTIRIPAKVKHSLLNTGTEPLRTLVSFSSGDRKTVFLEEQPAR